MKIDKRAWLLLTLAALLVVADDARGAEIVVVGEAQAKVLTVPLAPAPQQVDYGTAIFRALGNFATNVKQGAQQLAQRFSGQPAPQLVAQRTDKVNKQVAKPAQRAAVAQLAVNGVVQGGNANDALVMQFQTQFAPILISELSFIRTICEIPKAERPKIKKAGDAALKDAAQKYAKGQQQRQGNAGRIEPAVIIRTALAGALKTVLPEEQMIRYSEEAARRMALRKRAAIMNVVSRLDGILFLSPQQRDELTAALDKNWQVEWENWLMMAVYAHQYVPMIPDQHIVKHLNAEQKSVWNSLQKIQFGYYNFNMGAEVPDGADWWGEEAEEPAKPAAGFFIPNLNNFVRAAEPRVRVDPPAAKLEPEEIKHLIGLLAEKKQRGLIKDIRIPSARRLGAAGPAAKDAIPALEKMLDDKDPDVKAVAQEALKKIKEEN